MPQRVIALLKLFACCGRFGIKFTAPSVHVGFRHVGKRWGIFQMLQEDSDVFYLISSPGRMNSSKRQYTVLVSFSFSGFRGHCLHALDLLFFFRCQYSLSCGGIFEAYVSGFSLLELRLMPIIVSWGHVTVRKPPDRPMCYATLVSRALAVPLEGIQQGALRKEVVGSRHFTLSLFPPFRIFLQFAGSIECAESFISRAFHSSGLDGQNVVLLADRFSFWFPLNGKKCWEFLDLPP